jgi:hypothetical protein
MHSNRSSKKENQVPELDLSKAVKVSRVSAKGRHSGSTAEGPTLKVSGAAVGLSASAFALLGLSASDSKVEFLLQDNYLFLKKAAPEDVDAANFIKLNDYWYQVISKNLTVKIFKEPKHVAYFKLNETGKRAGGEVILYLDLSSSSDIEE